MWSWLADRLILCPTRDRIATEARRRWIEWDRGRCEAWVHGADGDRPPDLVVLKFPGTAGRAERSTSHPADCWSDLSAEVWTVNPPGYGGSPGRASLRNSVLVARAAWNAATQAAHGGPVLVTGNSLGTLSALYLAAHVAVGGLLIRNPVPLRELILSRHGRLASGIVRQVPAELCPIRNAARSRAPAVFVSCGQDRVVPPVLQHQVIRAYAGPHRVVRLADADHADPPGDWEQREYIRQLAWLREQFTASPGSPETGPSGAASSGPSPRDFH
jgi:hypothetical protein